MGPRAIEMAIGDRADVEEARRQARSLAGLLGFAPAEAEMAVLAVVELATNLVRHARGGTITLTPLAGPPGSGIEVASRDTGPGIADLDAALRDGCSTGGGRGDGLPGVRRLMDEFAIASGPGGTRITARKWRATP